ncbi:transposase [Paraburkholderia sp. J8-2]|uniref:transposase n=1 Tax=Paraburkholderia sp. J8-2 TaxID=2805440 RepID=UPI002AB604B2|nr:transposase [Paraburkholderia sp. J8-2]
MARLPRLYVPGQPQHVILTGYAGAPAFRDEQDYKLYVECLREAAREHGALIHGWALMPDAVHLIATPSTEESLPLTLQAIGRRYVAAFNRRYARNGTLWVGRYRSTVFEADSFFFLALRTVECAPVARGHAAEPGDWRWSSYRHHAGIEASALVTDHAHIWALGNTPFERQRAWKELLETPVDELGREALIEATVKGWLLGSDEFRARISGEASRRVAPLKRGRPKAQRNVPKIEPAGTAR